MGVFQGNCSSSSIQQKQCLRSSSSNSWSSSSLATDPCCNIIATRRMASRFGLSCFLPTCGDKGISRLDKNGGGEEEESNENNNNKEWLLAESGAEIVNADEPHSVHSSFRFSFCSQIELESMDVNNNNNENSSAASATVLMVNLDSGFSSAAARRGKELLFGWRKVQSLERSISPVSNSLIRFRYSEILSATSNFSQGRVLGRGAMSFVYRGRIGLLRASVAIKRLDKEDKESSKAFCRELMIASSLHHHNTVPLVGFCIDQEEGLFLVYKYVSGGSLDRHLHDKKRGLGWSVRYKVAVGVADAIAYLHTGTERCVVHRDIKPSNILLSSKNIPKLCDFGLATWTISPCVPFLCKTVKGTFGYLAPEYFQHGKVSDKTDVYAFGVVLLELITGRKPIEARRPPGEENLVQWAKPLLDKGKGAIEELLDPRLSCTTLRNRCQITQTIQAAAACLSSEESRRPRIDEIIAILRGEEGVLASEPMLLCSSGRRKSNLVAGIIDCYPTQPRETSSEITSHLALAMLGVSELEDDDQLYSR